MSGGAIFQHVLRRVNELALPEAVGPDLLAVLQAAHPGPLPVINEAGYEAGLSRETLLQRGAGVFFSFAAGNLADDLMDGDCTYLDRPVQLAPCYQFLLQNLTWSVLASAGIAPATLANAAGELARAAGPQPLEIRAEHFDPDLYSRVAEGIAGRQWGAYLLLMWAGTTLEPRALKVGRNMGFVSLLAGDIESDDRRFFSMSEDGRRQTLARGRALVESLRGEKLRTVDVTLPVAERAFGRFP